MNARVTAPVRAPVDAPVAERLVRGRRSRARRRTTVVAGLALLVLVLLAVSLMLGRTLYGPGDVVRVLLGQTVPGASFTVGELRLPRALLGLLAGASFGMAGVAFQTLLRNPLASPDVIGISSGASVAAVVAIVVLHLDETAVSLLAIVAALLTAGLVYLLAYVDGVAGTRLVLVGIGVAAMLDSVVSYVILRAAQWDLQTAMRWLTGSLNGATWGQVLPLATAFVLLAPLLAGQGRGLGLLRLGDDTATALGTRVERTRVVVIVLAVTLLAFATAATGPIAFVAFLSGPIAARATGVVGAAGSLLVPSALVGAALVLAADLLAQLAFGTRYPVGVVTGALGAPFLVLLLVRTNAPRGTL